MLKKLANILFSTRLTAVLFLVFALAMGIGTFMDAGQETSPTSYSRTLIYNAWWFETKGPAASEAAARWPEVMAPLVL